MAKTFCHSCDKNFLENYEDVCPYCGFNNKLYLETIRKSSTAARNLDVVRSEQNFKDHSKFPLSVYWIAYKKAVRIIWTSPSWWLFLLAIFVLGMRGRVDYPARVFPGILFLGLVVFPTMGYLFMLLLRYAAKRGIKL